MEEYDPELVEFAGKHSLKLPKLSCLRGQALALMSKPDMRGGNNFVTPATAEEFFKKNNLKTRDAIQPFNKMNQIGFKLIARTGEYSLVYPFEVDSVTLNKRVNVKLNIEQTREEGAAHVREYHQRHIMDVATEKWQIGHLDPTTSDNTAKNLAWQPPIQARTRNSLKFDREFFKKWPTGEELIRVGWREYYTEDEEKLLLADLLKRHMGSEPYKSFGNFLVLNTYSSNIDV